MKPKFLIFILLLIFSSAFAAVPPTINYQGRLTDTNGDPVADGQYGMVFTIYDDADAGSVLWTETHPSVQVTDGLINVVLGSITPLNDAVFAGTNTYLGIFVDGDAVLPRIKFSSVAYAYRLGTVDGATGGDISGFLNITPTNFNYEGNALVINDASQTSSIEIKVDEVGISTVTFYNPVDTKSAAATKQLAMRLTIDTSGSGSIGFYDPVDTKMSLAGELIPKVQVSKDGLLMYGQTGSDTSLYVSPDGDIVGLGQITMGQNSSSGIETSVLGFNNTADGDSSAIAGGSTNYTTGAISFIGGGFNNQTHGEGATVTGGAYNTASGAYSTISGGYNNQAPGDYSSIPGGDYNISAGHYSFAAGHRANANHNGSFVWADATDADFSSTAPDQFIIRASGGVGIGTDSPTGALDVVASPGNGSVNLPDDAVASEEIMDEPGIAFAVQSSDAVLAQATGVMTDIITVTITIPDDGYIVIRGSATLLCSGTSKINQAFAQIDETSGGGLDDPFYCSAGSGDYDTPSSTHFFSMYTERVYQKTAGTYTFRLEAMANPENANSAVSTIARSTLSATFMPTAYGTVSQ